MSAILVEDLTVSFNRVPVIESVSFMVNEGEFWAVVGPNGAGKTTLLRAIMGFIKPVKGKVTLFGMPPDKAISLGLIGYLPQRISVSLPLKVSEFLGLVSDDKARIEDVLTLMGIIDKKNQSILSLSGGERQRVFISMVLVRAPKLLILDEPSTGVDVVGQDSFYRTLSDLVKNYGFTILMVTHDVGVVPYFVDRVVCLNRRLKYVGDPKGILNEELLEEVYGDKVRIFVHHRECEGCHIFRSSL